MSQQTRAAWLGIPCGVIVFTIVIFHTILWGVLIVLFKALQFLSPLKALQIFFHQCMTFCGSGWIVANNVLTNFFVQPEIIIEGDLSKLSKKESYFIVSNHISWVDILVIHRVLGGQVPFIRFFIKRELIFLPLFGLVWLALDFPFMRRYSKEDIQKKPEKKGKDIEEIQKACARLKKHHFALLNFLEGTRFTPDKHLESTNAQGRYQNLLPPKAGGFALSLEAVGEEFDALLDITLAYPHQKPNFWSWLSGYVRKVHVEVKKRPVPQGIVKGQYLTDPDSQKRARQFVDELWREKDERITQFNQK